MVVKSSWYLEGQSWDYGPSISDVQEQRTNLQQEHNGFTAPARKPEG